MPMVLRDDGYRFFFWSNEGDEPPHVHVRAGGDKVAVRGTISGTHQGDLMGIPPTGRQVTVTLIDVNRIEGGKLVERWGVSDMLGMMQQLGVMEQPSGQHFWCAHKMGRLQE